MVSNSGVSICVVGVDVGMDSVGADGNPPAVCDIHNPFCEIRNCGTIAIVLYISSDL